MLLRFSLPLVALCGALVFSSCSVLKKEEVASLRRRGVSEPTVQKMTRPEGLLPGEVIELKRRGVPDELVLRYIRKTGIRYVVSKDDSLRMRSAGVSPAVIDLLARETAKFAADYAVTHGQTSVSTFDEPVGPLLLEPGYVPVY